MRTLLVHPNFTDRYGSEYHRFFPLGLPYISSALKKLGFEVDCLNLNYFENPDEYLLSRISEGKYSILATTGLSAEFVSVRQMIQRVKQANPNIVIVLGGGMITSQPELIMNLLPVDYGILGEGEITAGELWKALHADQDVRNVAGLVYRDHHGNLRFTGTREEILDIGTIAWPDYDGFNFPQYLEEQKYKRLSIFNYHGDNVRTVYMIASRSCPFKCTFCFRPLGSKYRQRPLNDFFDELAMLVEKYGINTVHLLDDLLTYDKERLMEFCERIRTFKISWLSQARGDGGLDQHTTRMMKESGCVHFAFGVESASEKILQSLNKREHFTNIERSLKVVRDAGIPTGGNFIFGDVEEDWQTATFTMDWWKAHQDYFIELMFITCYPGSHLYKTALEKGKITDEVAFLEQGCPLINISKMSDDEYHKWNDCLRGYKAKHRVFARDIEVRKGCDEGRDLFYEMEVRCPGCNQSVVYGNVFIPPAYNDEFVSVCRYCGQYFVVDNPYAITQMPQLARQLYSLDKMLKMRKVGLFGAGKLAAAILRSRENRLRPVCIFDNDTMKHGESLEGVMITPFANDSLYLRDMDTIIITAPTFKSDIITQITYDKINTLNIVVIDYDVRAGYSVFLMIQ